MINSFEGAMLCNDIENLHRYRVVGDKLYFNDELILYDIKEKILTEDGKIIRDISFKPVKPAHYVEIKVGIKI